MAFFELKGIEKALGKTKVLCGIDLAMEKGETLALIGSSGSGKTTLLRCINFLERPDAGEMYLNGQRLYAASETRRYSDRALRELRLHFGLVFQHFNLFPQYTVLENLCLAPTLLAAEDRAHKSDRKQIRAKIEEKALELLEKVGLSQKKTAYPGQLSGGQQQRVAIARALILNPDVLCFDEPTSALDPELTEEVLNVLKELARDKVTMLIVTHELAFAREAADRVLFMDNGQIAEQGEPQAIFGAPQTERLREFLRAAQSHAQLEKL